MVLVSNFASRLSIFGFAVELVFNLSHYAAEARVARARASIRGVGVHVLASRVARRGRRVARRHPGGGGRGAKFEIGGRPVHGFEK